MSEVDQCIKPDSRGTVIQQGIIDKWAKQFVQIANRKPGEVITDSTAFTLRPF